MNAALLLLTLAAPPPAFQGDKVLQAMDAETKRAMTLKMPKQDGQKKADPPYYARSYVVFSERWWSSASLGAVVNVGSDRHGQVQGRVRVGTADFDNTNFAGGDPFGGDFDFDFDRSPAPPPSVDDVDAIRHSLWLDFDSSFKRGVESIAKKRAFFETNEVKDRVADFGPAKPELVLEAERPVNVDLSKWSDSVKKASAVFRSHPAIQSGTVNFRVRRQVQRMVASDGAAHRFDEAYWEVWIDARSQAKDGMPLKVSWSERGQTEADLPDEKTLVEAAQKAAADLDALVKVPAATDDYVGPVLFSGKAAASLFLNAVGAQLTAPVEQLGHHEQGRLTDRLGKHIGPHFLKAIDDPSLPQWKSPQGRVFPLFGWVPVDDDGVKPMPITLIDEGVLKTYYMSRVPTRRVPLTNGHARNDLGMMGNLLVSSTEPTTTDKLKKQLIQLAKEEDLDFGLRVEALEESRFGSRGASLSLPSPVIAYKVFADGHEEMVRGFNFKPTTSRMLKDIVAMADDPDVLNTTLVDQSVAVVAPSTLVRLLEATPTKADWERPPILAHPSMK
ncbi:MAG: metallopeptidase TldD-related protein [Myxococcaceae bacterium]